MEEGVRAIGDRQEVTQATTASTVNHQPRQHPDLMTQITSSFWLFLSPSTLSESLNVCIFRTPPR
ncbi:hypothetical protein JAAARDRAFT_191606 [Jaapia argillacea MUCL 33604]|uniref:Uncharacterized protein n=1 Tax=Jaapia argillacea MUCL 33604 TaxID=933084 RepID=A0A067Q9L1_9AGAM|nr:hypothetical protein JAAARDRAFT_191606 [Jaapia argillacea MUCL 33604]